MGSPATAAAVASAIDEGLSGQRDLGDALADYEVERNKTVSDMYTLTCDLARLEPPTPELSQLLEALRYNPPETDRFLGTLVGTVPIPEFFAPENIQRIVDSVPKR